MVQTLAPLSKASSNQNKSQQMLAFLWQQKRISSDHNLKRI